MQLVELPVHQDPRQGDHMTLAVAGFDHGYSGQDPTHQDRLDAVQDAGLLGQRFPVGDAGEERRQRSEVVAQDAHSRLDLPTPSRPS
jgi:hypothetical protein